MTSRLLLTTAIGLALGIGAFSSGAFAQSAAVSTMPSAITLSEGVSVSEQDRARIDASLARMNVKSLRGVDFSVAVGSRVPRELRVHRIPADVGQIVPQYRDYRFLVVEKDVIIVEPKTNKIVTILKPHNAVTTTATNEPPAAAKPAEPAPAVTAPAPAAPVTEAPAPAAPVVAAPTTPAITQPAAEPSREAAAQPERPKAKKQATRTQRRTVSRAERDEWRRSNAEVRIGQRVPDDVVLYRLPPRYYREVPVSREYRYRGYASGWRGRPIYQEFD